MPATSDPEPLPGGRPSDLIRDLAALLSDAYRRQYGVDDAARALILAAEHVDTSEPFNVGTGVETVQAAF